MASGVQPSEGKLAHDILRIPWEACCPVSNLHQPHCLVAGNSLHVQQHHLCCLGTSINRT